MVKNKLTRNFLVFALMVFVSVSSHVLAGENNPYVSVSFYPLEYFAKRIIGDKIQVVNPVPASEDPIFWNPKREGILALQKSDLIILNGAGFEKWVEVVSLPKDKTVITTASFSKNFLKYESAVTHSHGGGVSHSHEGFDGHTWMDPVNAMEQSLAIKTALIIKFPLLAEDFEKNFVALKKDLKDLDTELRKINMENTLLFMSHPAYNYIAKRYKWKIRNITLDPKVMPDETTKKEFDKIIKFSKTKILIWESEPLAYVSDFYLNKWALQSVVFSPCEGLLEAEQQKGIDYITIMKANIEALKNAVQAKVK